MVLFVVIFLLYYFSSHHRWKRLYFVLSFFVFLLALGAILGAYKQYTIQNSKTPAIIFAKETSVTSEPNMGSEEIFKLHEGTKVKDRKSTRLNSSHVKISYAVFCLKKKNITIATRS